ncbi:MAG: nucleotidyltransferase domain-containing protein [Planctomycetes bacterium]|nr:nucleotidyltransferase domain-containing protein [Planctomycetota bacterium]
MAQKKIPSRVKREIALYIKKLKKEKLPIERAILFGSYAKRTQKKWSDIDLCIVSTRFKDPLRAMQYLWSQRLPKYQIRIEPVGFHPKDFSNSYDSLIQEIKKTGIEL